MFGFFVPWQMQQPGRNVNLSVSTNMPGQDSEVSQSSAVNASGPANGAEANYKAPPPPPSTQGININNASMQYLISLAEDDDKGDAPALSEAAASSGSGDPWTLVSGFQGSGHVSHAAANPDPESLPVTAPASSLTPTGIGAAAKPPPPFGDDASKAAAYELSQRAPKARPDMAASKALMATAVAAPAAACPGPGPGGPSVPLGQADHYRPPRRRVDALLPTFDGPGEQCPASCLVNGPRCSGRCDARIGHTPTNWDVDDDMFIWHSCRCCTPSMAAFDYEGPPPRAGGGGTGTGPAKSGAAPAKHSGPGQGPKRGSTLGAFNSSGTTVGSQRTPGVSSESRSAGAAFSADVAALQNEVERLQRALALSEARNHPLEVALMQATHRGHVCLCPVSKKQLSCSLPNLSGHGWQTQRQEQ